MYIFNINICRFLSHEHLMNVLTFHLSNIGALLFYFCALVGCLMHPLWESLLLADEIVVRGVGPGVEGRPTSLRHVDLLPTTSNSNSNQYLGFPGGSECKESACNEGDLVSIPGLGRFPWRRAWQPTPVFLPGESPWTEEPGGLQCMGLQRVGHN